MAFVGAANEDNQEEIGTSFEDDDNEAPIGAENDDDEEEDTLASFGGDNEDPPVVVERRRTLSPTARRRASSPGRKSKASKAPPSLPKVVAKAAAKRERQARKERQYLAELAQGAIRTLTSSPGGVPHDPMTWKRDPRKIVHYAIPMHGTVVYLVSPPARSQWEGTLLPGYYMPEPDANVRTSKDVTFYYLGTSFKDLANKTTLDSSVKMGTLRIVEGAPANVLRAEILSQPPVSPIEFVQRSRIESFRHAPAIKASAECCAEECLVPRSIAGCALCAVPVGFEYLYGCDEQCGCKNGEEVDGLFCDIDMAFCHPMSYVRNVYDKIRCCLANIIDPCCPIVDPCPCPVVDPCPCPVPVAQVPVQVTVVAVAQPQQPVVNAIPGFPAITTGRRINACEPVLLGVERAQMAILDEWKQRAISARHVGAQHVGAQQESDDDEEGGSF